MEVSCSYCGSSQLNGFIFCSKCGKKNEITEEKENRKSKRINIHQRMLASYTLVVMISLLISSVFNISAWYTILSTIALATIDVSFALRQKTVFNLLNVKNVNLKSSLLFILLGVGTAITVHIFVDSINDYIGVEQSYLYEFNEFRYPFLLAIVFIGVFPAFFEELAFRGFVFNNIKVLGEKKIAIVGSSFLFAIMHFSLLSILWLVPFAMLLAYLRNKHNTLVYGIIIHFTHNTTIITIEYITQLN